MTKFFLVGAVIALGAVGARGQDVKPVTSSAIYYLGYVDELRDDRIALAEGQANYETTLAERTRDTKLYEMNHRLFLRNSISEVDYRTSLLQLKVSQAKVTEADHINDALRRRISAYELLEQRSLGHHADLSEIHKAFTQEWLAQCSRFEASVDVADAQHEYALFDNLMVKRLQAKSHESYARLLETEVAVTRAEAKKRHAEEFLKKCRQTPNYAEVSQLKFP